MATPYTVARLQEALATPGHVLIFDVRTPEEFKEGSIPGAVNVPAGNLSGTAPTIPYGLGVVCVCTRGGNRSQSVAAQLRGSGFDATHLSGGLEAWAAATGGPKPGAHG